MLNEALKLIRVFHELSQKDLSIRLGISKSYISEIEAGKKNPTMDVLEKYSSEFDIPVSSILFFSENLYKNPRTESLRLFASSKILSMLKLVQPKDE